MERKEQFYSELMEVKLGRGIVYCLRCCTHQQRETITMVDIDRHAFVAIVNKHGMHNHKGTSFLRARLRTNFAIKKPQLPANQ